MFCKSVSVVQIEQQLVVSYPFLGALSAGPDLGTSNVHEPTFFSKTPFSFKFGQQQVGRVKFHLSEMRLLILSFSIISGSELTRYSGEMLFILFNGRVA